MLADHIPRFKVRTVTLLPHESSESIPSPTGDSGASPMEYSSGSSRLWRRAVGIERLICALHDEVSGCGRVVSIARFSGPYDEQAIERVLRNVSQQCPHATMKINRLSSGEYEFRIPTVPLFPPIEMLEVRDAGHGCSLAVLRGRENFSRGHEPALRWIVLRCAVNSTFQLVGLAHHALFDAGSMAILIRRFLETLGSQSTHKWDWPPPGVPHGKWSTFRTHLSLTARYCREFHHLLRACKGPPQDVDSPGACVVSRWSAAETNGLIRACRGVRVTLTATLGIMGMVAFNEHYGSDMPVIDLDVPVNLRRYLLPECGDQAIGMFAMIAKFAVDFRRPVDIVAQSQRISQYLRACVASESLLRLYHLINLVVPNRIKLPRSPAPSCVSSNSLGIYEVPRSPSGVELLEWGWFANGGPYMAAFSQSAVTVNGCLSITSYSTWLSPQRVHELSSAVDRQLRTFAGL